MADFRKWCYALALIALLAGLSAPASAQNAPFQCTTSAGVPPEVRAEGWTELVGDVILNCTGGIPTPAGQVVQPVNLQVSITTNLTSRLLSGGIWTEALAIIDEPHSAVNPTRPILNCGNSSTGAVAPDNGPSGKNVCAIVATQDPSRTYDGTSNGYNGTCTGAAGGWIPGQVCTGTFTSGVCGTTGNPAAGSYSCGRPNVFQGRIGSPNNTSQLNAVSWLGLPLDPPGTTTNRTIRITNIRADAHDVGVNAVGNFFLNTIQAQIAINGNTSLALSSTIQTVAYVAQGLIAKVGTTNFSFLQCVAEPSTIGTAANAIAGNPQVNGFHPSFTFQEGFASSWKAKNISFITNSTSTGYTGNGALYTAASYWSYDGGFAAGNATAAAAAATMNYPKDFNQNVPGAIYNTESGFLYNGNDPDPGPSPLTNPPFGTGTQTIPITATCCALSNSTGISGAGQADAGTRLMVSVTNIPAGSNVYVPYAIYLYNGVNYPSTTTPAPSGIAVLTNTASDGSGSFSPLLSSCSGSTCPSTADGATKTFTLLPSTGLAVYEVLFADPFSIETATVPFVVQYQPALNLGTNGQPDPTKTAQATGSFAPLESAAGFASTGPVPRFATSTTSGGSPNLFSVSKCACDLLFPYVVSAGNYDTGIAIANTSMDNLGNGGSSLALNQFGTVTFWFYGTQNGGGAPPSQTSASVPAGQVLAYELSQGGGFITNSTGGTSHGLTPVNGFTGYVIAQAQFQYCHAYAFIGGLGAGPLSQGVSEGYLGLILDNKSWACQNGGICRTNQNAENLVH